MIKDSVLQLIGNTPMVYLNRLGRDCEATLAAKLELFNPMSVKDRPVLYIIEEAERKGLITKDTTIVEATSGNTGLALAYVCAVRGYRLIICMNEEMSEERKSVLRLFGAELELTPPATHTVAARERARQLCREIPDSFYVNQHDNPANIKAHYETTAHEIWKDTKGKVDIVVTALGTAGTAMGIAKALKPRKPLLQVVGIEPKAAPMLSQGRWAEHKLPGTSPGFVPELYDADLLDEVVLVDPESEAYPMCRRLVREEGLLVGISSGATAVAALKLAKKPEHGGKLIVAIFADTGQRYLSVEGLFR